MTVLLYERSSMKAVLREGFNGAALFWCFHTAWFAQSFSRGFIQLAVNTHTRKHQTHAGLRCCLFIGENTLCGGRTQHFSAGFNIAFVSNGCKILSVM